MKLNSERFARQLDWNLLRTFLVIAEEKSLTRAGERLLLCQPTISGALRRLEDRLGCKLVDRGPAHFRLTEAGNRLHERCQEIYNGIASLSDIAVPGDPELSGRVRLRTVSSVGNLMLDNFVAAFSRAHPKVFFEVSVANSADTLTAVARGKLAMGISMFRQNAADIQFTELCHETFELFCGKLHPFFDAPRVARKSLATAGWVEFGCEREQNTLHPLALFKSSHGVGDRVVATSNNVDELKSLIRNGVGIGMLPSHCVDQELRAGTVRAVRSDLPALEVPVFVAVNPKAAANAAETAFRDFMLDKLRRTEPKATNAPKELATAVAL